MTESTQAAAAAARRMEGRTALVTGGTSGIGLATAQLLEAEGARVAINGRDAGSVARALSLLSPDAIGIPGHVERLDDLDAMMARVQLAFGGLDTLVLCAGVMSVSPLADITEAEFDSSFGVNVKGVLFAVQKAAPLMRRGGSIVLVASGTRDMGRVRRTVYAASKAAVRSLARSLAAELVPAGIRVNAVSPGPIATRINRAPQQTAAEQAAALGRMVPMGRAGSVEEVAAAILFLASDASSFVLGADLAVDGGWAQLHEIPPAPPASGAQ